MSDIIHLLPDSVANQIAAGEVIQRPSSVVKELVENAIDAEATVIKVLVNEAGKSVIQVTDNGKGMSEMDARLAFERHATSKIAEADDLYNLRTMGFRGEALASICAVAQVELRTKARGEEVGYAVTIHGGKFMSEQPIGCPEGATFMVRNLFYNIPARRKFLKKNQTELSNIIQELERVALAHPEIEFKFYSNDVLLSDFPESTFKKRIVSVFGKKYDKMLLPLDVETAPAHITGFVGKPDSSRKQGAKQFFFVNGRYMRHPYFAKAVQSAYERLIPDGDQVPFFISFQVDPASIDVNIHPTKTEIKFDDENTLWQIIQASVRESLAKYSEMPMIDFDVENKPEIPVFDPLSAPKKVNLNIDEDYNPFADEKEEQPRNWQEAYERAFGINKVNLTNDKLEREISNLSAIEIPKVNFPQHPSDRIDIEEEKDEDLSLFSDHPNEELEPITTDKSLEFDPSECFQYDGRYIVASVPLGILMVDQHRAHVRVLFERYMSKMEKKVHSTQLLLFPTIVQFSPSESPYLHDILPELRNIGFELKAITSTEYEISGVPAGSEKDEPANLLLDVVHQALNFNSSIGKSWHFGVALGLAKKTAMPYGEQLTSSQMAALMKDLLQSSMPNYTPEGKKIFTLLEKDKLEAIFS